MSEAEQDRKSKLTPEVEAFLQRLYRDPRYLLIGKIARYGRDRVSFVEGCTLVSSMGDVRGQALLNREYELRGRPDGDRPYGTESLLDYHLSRDRGDPVALEEDDLTALQEESWQYYVRRNFAFLMGDFAQARDDAEHNLGIGSLVARSQVPDARQWSYLKWYPWIERDRAIAQALWDLRHQDTEHAATELYRAQRSIEHFGEQHAAQYREEEGEAEPLCAHLRQHIESLVDILRREAGLPIPLEQQLDQAAERGDEAEIERLRAEMIRRAMAEEE